MEGPGSRVHDGEEMRAARAILALGLAVAPAFLAPPARADYDFQIGASLNAGWLRRMPSLRSDGVSTAARELGAGELRSDFGLALLGFETDLEVVVDDRWRVPLFGGALYGALGAYDRQVTSYDGSIARIRPWSAMRLDLLLPGVGYRWKHRRTMWGVAVRTGYSVYEVGGSVADGAYSLPIELGASTFVVQAELETCRRLDPTFRVCAQIVPRVYEHELLNGFTVGVRLEFGR